MAACSPQPTRCTKIDHPPACRYGDMRMVPSPACGKVSTVTSTSLFRLRPKQKRTRFFFMYENETIRFLGGVFSGLVLNKSLAPRVSDLPTHGLKTASRVHSRRPVCICDVLKTDIRMLASLPDRRLSTKVKPNTGTFLFHVELQPFIASRIWEDGQCGPFWSQRIVYTQYSVVRSVLGSTHFGFSDLG